jgi:hypothetical protein
VSFARPSPYISDELGGGDDTVVLTLNGKAVKINQTWEHTEGILSQPGTWRMELGWGGVIRPLLQMYPKRTPFRLLIGGVPQAVGYTDGPEVDQPPGGAASLAIVGRDMLAKLQDTYVKAQASVNVDTYAKLCWYALQKCDLAPAGDIDPDILHTDNAANRALKGGVPVRPTAPHRTVQQIIDDTGLGGANAGVVHTVPLAKVGETWHSFLRRYLDRAGLFFWAAADGSFVLAQPDGDQNATYQLRRRAVGANAALRANAVGCKYRDIATGRHTEVILYGRGGGKIVGNVKAKGNFIDQEMVDAGYGDQPLVMRDVHVHSGAEAEYFARRKIAEERRAGWQLEYTIPGLTLPYAGDGGKTRAVLIPDTVIEVQDDELGLYSNYYIETVTRRRSPQTTTTIRLMRIEDLLFGTDDPPD